MQYWRFQLPVIGVFEGDGKRKLGNMLSGGMPVEYMYGERNKHQKTFGSR